MTKNFKIFKIVTGTFFCLVGIFLLGNYLLPVDRSEYILPEEKLMVVSGYLIDDPYYHKNQGRGNGEYFEVKLSRYPGVKFRNEGVFLRATDWENIRSLVKYHDTVFLKVFRPDFEKKYLDRASMTTFEKMAAIPYDKFNFYSFKFRNKEYVSDLYEAAKDHQSDNALLGFVLGFGFTGFGIYAFYAKK